MKTRRWKPWLSLLMALCLTLTFSAAACGTDAASVPGTMNETEFYALVAESFPAWIPAPYQTLDQTVTFRRALAILCDALGRGGQTDAQNLSFALENDLIPGIALASDDPLPQADAQPMVDAFAALHDIQAEDAWNAWDASAVSDGAIMPSSAGMSGAISMTVPTMNDDRMNFNDMNDESYGAVGENRFLNPVDSPFSTFALDVDTASYANIRRRLIDGSWPDRGAVRIEEMLNYFSYTLPEPTAEAPIAITTELSRCPWNSEHQLAMVALSSYAPAKAELPGSNLVFLVDVSGSMEASNRLPLIRKALKLLLTTLDAKDRISIITYAGTVGVLLDTTPADMQETITAAIDRMNAGGSTNGEGGIRAAYDIAREAYIKGGNNRVILLTDGDFNVGVQSASELETLITGERDSGIYLSVLGFGMGNLKDYEMETLSNYGNGNYAYIDTLKEAKKVFVEDMTGTIFTVADDVKLQVEFNPLEVSAYRLIGYENRLLETEDFADDQTDAGEMGANRRMIALYEIVPAVQGEPTAPTAESRYQAKTTVPSDEALYVSVRYRLPESTETVQTGCALAAAETQGDMSETMAFASAVAEFGLLLSDSAYKAEASYEQASALALANRGEDAYGYRAELVQLINLAQLLAKP